MRATFAVLLACLALPAARAQAQTAAAPGQTSVTPPPQTQDALLAQIEPVRQSQFALPANVWATEFAPRVDALEAEIVTARTAGDLAKAQSDFAALQNDLQRARSRQTGNNNATRVSPPINPSAAAALNPYISKIGELPGQLFDGSGTGGSDGIFAPPPGTSLPQRWAFSPGHNMPSTSRLSINPLPLPAPTAKALPMNRLQGYLDRSGIRDALIKNLEKIPNWEDPAYDILHGFAGACYNSVNWMLKLKDINLPSQIGSDYAYMLSLALKNHPRLQNLLHLRSLDLTTVNDASRIPERTLFIFGRGCDGFSSAGGHVEYSLRPDKLKDLPVSAFCWVGAPRCSKPSVVKPGEILACSDGCMIHSLAHLAKLSCLTTYVPVTR